MSNHDELNRLLARMDRARLDRRKLIKLGAAGLSASSLAAILAACGGSSNSNTPASSSGGGTATGSTATSSGSSGGATTTVKFEGWNYEPPLVQQNIDRFKSLNPNIAVNYTAIEGSQYRQKLVAEYTAKADPDALYVRDDYFAGWVSAEYLQPIDGMPGIDDVYNKIYDLNASAMTFGGKRYGLPYYTDVMCLCYNADILNKAGISDPPKTLDEWTTQLKKIDDAKVLDGPPMAFAFKQTNDFWTHWWALIYGSQAHLFDDQMNPQMDSKDTVAKQVLTWLGENMKAKLIDPASVEMDGNALTDAFVAGQYAFHFLARYDVERVNSPDRSKIAGSGKMAMIPSIDGKTEGTVGWTRMYCLSKNTDVKDAAYKLNYYLGGLDENGKPYTAKFWFMQRGLGFAYKELKDDPDVTAKLEKFADPTIYNHLAEVGRARENINEPWYSEWESNNQSLMQQYFIGQKSVDDVMKGMADSAKKLKKQYE